MAVIVVSYVLDRYMFRNKSKGGRLCSEVWKMKRKIDHKVLQIVFNYGDKDLENRSFEEIRDYEYVVTGPAYKDFTPRTLKGCKKDDIRPALNTLAKDLYEFIHRDDIKSQKDYNVWHKETCEKFKNNFNSKFNGGEIKFGKAQKIVNMSFKYLFCFDDSQQEKYADKFRYCHMPLDSYTLDWFSKKVLPKYNECKEKDNKIKAGKIKETSWSSLEYGEEHEEYSYAWIQNEIRNYLNSEDNQYVDENGNNLSPFIAEFYIWPEQQLKSACNSFLKLENNLLNQKNLCYTDYKINEYSVELCKIADILKKELEL